MEPNRNKEISRIENLALVIGILGVAVTYWAEWFKSTPA